MKRKPIYLYVDEKGWEEKLEQAHTLLTHCRCCHASCHVNREQGERGACCAGLEPYIASAGAHFGEEPPISGLSGSGTIFFTFCPMKCVYCQNYPFSQLGQGRERGVEGLASSMITLQERGCHNINLVTPTHFAPQIIRALKLAVARGLCIPIVYNTSSYDSLEVLALMDGIVDIYLADLRYADEAHGLRYSGIKGYPAASRDAAKEMYRQVGLLKVDESGIAERGLVIRHLVLPNHIAGTREVFRFIAEELSPEAYISLMSQYFPTFRAAEYPELNRRITNEEYTEALALLDEFGLTEGWAQSLEEVMSNV